MTARTVLRKSAVLLLVVVLVITPFADTGVADGVETPEVSTASPSFDVYTPTQNQSSLEEDMDGEQPDGDTIYEWNITTQTATKIDRPSDGQNLSTSIDRIEFGTVVLGDSVLPEDNRVPDTTLGPYSAAAYQTASVPAGGGTIYTKQCSAVMVSPYHAVTAGHCLTEYNYFSPYFPQRYYITPGRAYNKSVGAVRPFGDAKAVKIRTPTKWAIGKGSAHDYALVTLDRPIGRDSGWVGYAAYSPDDPFRGYVTSAGYPRFSSIQYDTRGYAYTSGLKLGFDLDIDFGKSGSGVWHYDSAGNPLLLATVSQFGAGARITGDRFVDIHTWIREDTPPEYYVELVDDRNVDFRLDKTEGAPGELLNVSHGVRNIGTQTANGEVRYYLSTDGTFDSSDTYVGALDTGELEMLSNTNVTGSLTIPNTSAGEYSLIRVVAEDGSAPVTDALLPAVVVGPTLTVKDVESPSFTVDIEYVPEYTSSDSVELFATFSGANTPVTVEITGGKTPVTLSTTENFLSTPVELAEGENQLEITVTDSTGTANSAVYTVTKDTSSPSVSSFTLNPYVEVLPGSPMTASINASDNTSPITRVTIDGKELSKTSNNEWTGTINAAPEMGIYSLTATVEDAAGNRAFETTLYLAGVPIREPGSLRS
jgi:V8-like Glu-specific endopeptidase